MYSQTLAELRAYVDSYMRHAGPLEAQLARGEELTSEDQALLCGRLLRLLARLHLGRELLLERRALADVRFAEALVDQARAIANEAVAETMDRKIDFRLEQLRFAHVYHEMTGYYHDLLGARSEIEALVRELPELPAAVLARDLLTTIDAALSDKSPRLEELWVGPFGRLDDFAVHYPRSHWWWHKR